MAKIYFAKNIQIFSIPKSNYAFSFLKNPNSFGQLKDIQSSLQKMIK